MNSIDNNKSAFAEDSADKPIVILGGGPTGLAAAYRLSGSGKKVILLEKEKHLGGLSATLPNKDFLFEYGPHAFHLNDPVIIAWVKKILGRDFRVIATNTKVLIGNTIFNYPLKADELIRKISPILGARIVFDYLVAHTKNVITKRKIESFQDWGLTNFGPTLYKISFGDYTGKVWGVSPAKLSANLASQKLARLNLGDIIKKLLGLKGKNQPAYFKKYLYPEKGASLIFGLMQKELQKNVEIIFEANVTHLEREKNTIEAVEYQDALGKKKKIDCSRVISTLTIRDLVAMINSPLTSKIAKNAQNLSYRDLIIVYLVIKKESISEAQWTYLVENKFRFNRFTEGKNLSPRFAPKGKTVLSFEICCQKNDNLWRMSDRDLVGLVKKDLKKLNLERLEISDFFIKRLENAYPMFRLGFETKLKAVLEEISQIGNLISTGRNGLFLNSDIHDCFKMGFEAAEYVKTNQDTKNWYEEVQNTWLKNL